MNVIGIWSLPNDPGSTFILQVVFYISFISSELKEKMRRRNKYTLHT